MQAVIAGGGIGGLTAALALARRGWAVQVFEQAAELGDVGAGIQVSPNAARVLHALGLEPGLRRVGFLPQAIETRGWRHGQLISALPLGDAAVARWGFPYWHVHRGDLLRLLADAVAAEPQVVVHTGQRVERFSVDGAGVQVEATSARVEADLLVGADGIRSVVREALFGAAAPVFTGNVAWRALVPASRLPPGHIPPTATAWWGPGRHFVHYYVRGGAFVNCVCVVEKDGWETESWTARGDHAELQADFAGWHSDIRLLIDRMDPDACFKWALFDRPPMPQWSRGPVTLLGDACHPTLPFMAQGAAMAIEDAAVLAACVPAPGIVGVEGDAGAAAVPAALRRYEQLRRARTAGVQLGSRRNATVFHLRGVAAWLRNKAAGRAGNAALERLYDYDALAAAG